MILAIRSYEICGRTPQLWATFQLLVRRRVVQPHMICPDTGAESGARECVRRLRKALKPTGIKIICVRSCGYCILKT